MGQLLTYTVTLTNQSRDTATGVLLTDTLPAGVTFVSASAGCTPEPRTVLCAVGALGGGQSTIRTIQVKAPFTTGPIENRVVVSATETDPDPTNNEATVVTAVQQPVRNTRARM